MKIIVSHDVDHITVWEHKRDLVIPKFIVRSSIELVTDRINFTEFLLRLKELARNKYQNLEELMEFDRENKVPSTFFVGVNHGLGLCYSLKDAEYWIKKIIEKGFDVGVHGIGFDNLEVIKEEYKLFKKLSGLSSFGTRMHYLRNSKDTPQLLSQAGYIFDTTLCKMENPFRINNLWEFPLHIMDGYLFYKGKSWQNQTLGQAKQETRIKLDRASNDGIKYFTILLHDRYFSDSFKNWKDWYIWTVGYLKKSGFEFTNYRKAIQELGRKA